MSTGRYGAIKTIKCTFIGGKFFFKKGGGVLFEKIKFIFDDEKARVGAPRIIKRLNREGNCVGKQRVARIMKEHGLRAKASKKFKATTNSNHQLPVAPNLLEQNFYANKPNEKWVSDITYCWTNEGWLYLAVVMDIYSRKVVGWACQNA